MDSDKLDEIRARWDVTKELMDSIPKTAHMASEGVADGTFTDIPLLLDEVERLNKVMSKAYDAIDAMKYATDGKLDTILADLYLGAIE